MCLFQNALQSNGLRQSVHVTHIPKEELSVLPILKHFSIYSTIFKVLEIIYYV